MTKDYKGGAMSMTPTELRYSELLQRYKGYSRKRANEAAWFVFRGGVDFGVRLQEREDTNVTANGVVVDLDLMERVLRLEAERPALTKEVMRQMKEARALYRAGPEPRDGVIQGAP
jgi:hypothetical protein